VVDDGISALLSQSAKTGETCDLFVIQNCKSPNHENKIIYESMRLFSTISAI
jgi:hypothetical protein